MKKYKPDQNEKISIRLSVDIKSKLADVCRDNDLDEAMVARTALEAGLQLVRERGIAAMMDKRGEIIAPVPVKKPKKDNRKSFSLRKGEGSGWNLFDPNGKKLMSGPLYQLRPKAKKLCSDEFGVVLYKEDGTQESLG